MVQREYSYDELGRPTARNTARQGAVVNDVFAHNSRSELSSARVNGVSYGYAEDSAGKREETKGESAAYDPPDSSDPFARSNSGTHPRNKRVDELLQAGSNQQTMSGTR